MSMRLCRSTKLKSGSSYSFFAVSACRVLHLRWPRLLQFVCQTLSLSLPLSLPVSLSLCLSLSLSLSVSVSMHPEAEEGFKELSKISDRETWPGTILKRYQNDNRSNGKVVICEYLAIPFSSYSRKMESYVRCAACSRKASGHLPLVRSPKP